MALRDQPYLPLYVQDFLTDEKLNECSAEANGVYIRIMCIMHKSEEYGTILLKQNDKQSDKPLENFAEKLTKHLPYPTRVILKALEELTSEKVLSITGDKMIQKRMVADNEISIKRAESGRKGGIITQFAKANAKANAKAKIKASAENENENENEDDNVNVINYQFIVDNYHELCPKMNKVLVVNKQRKGLMNARVGEYGLEKVIAIIRMAGESSFLNGMNDKAWKADFDWIMSPNNFIKIMENKFQNKKQSDRPPMKW